MKTDPKVNKWNLTPPTFMTSHRYVSHCLFSSVSEHKHSSKVKHWFGKLKTTQLNRTVYQNQLNKKQILSNIWIRWIDRKRVLKIWVLNGTHLSEVRKLKTKKVPFCQRIRMRFTNKTSQKMGQKHKSKKNTSTTEGLRKIFFHRMSPASRTSWVTTEQQSPEIKILTEKYQNSRFTKRKQRSAELLDGIKDNKVEPGQKTGRYETWLQGTKFKICEYSILNSQQLKKINSKQTTTSVTAA